LICFSLLDDVKRTIRQTGLNKVQNLLLLNKGPAAQAPGLTANVPPVGAAPPGSNQLAGLTQGAPQTKTVRERILEDDPLFRGIA
jgi:hypothetical protein